MLTEICQEIRNWFDRDQDKYYGEFTISEGAITSVAEMGLKDGQYYRIIGSTFNDGVHRNDHTEELVDETFNGSVWAMAVPPAVILLNQEIEEWQEKNGGVDSQNMGPFQSESFGGYSYSKGSYGSSSNGTSGPGATWKSMFADRLNRWRKI
jgi:hypothetical protein